MCGLFFMSSTSFVYATFLHHLPAEQNISLFHFIFGEHFYGFSVLEPTSFQLSQLDVGPLSGIGQQLTIQKKNRNLFFKKELFAQLLSSLFKIAFEIGLINYVIPEN